MLKLCLPGATPHYLFLTQYKIHVTACIRLHSTSAIVLRPYQESCIESCLTSLASGCSRIGVSLPTGSGKTTVFLTLLSRLLPLNTRATRSLIIVNSIELARQTAIQARRLFPTLSVEIEQGTRHQATGEADLWALEIISYHETDWGTMARTVATYQTLLRPSRLEKFDPSALKAIVVDEAHHAAAASWAYLRHAGISLFKIPADIEESCPILTLMSVRLDHAANPLVTYKVDLEYQFRS
jgi:ATP-dependent helicase IRC3